MTKILVVVNDESRRPMKTNWPIHITVVTDQSGTDQIKMVTLIGLTDSRPGSTS